MRMDCGKRCQYSPHGSFRELSRHDEHISELGIVYSDRHGVRSGVKVPSLVSCEGKVFS